MSARRLGVTFKMTNTGSYRSARKSTLYRLSIKKTDVKKAYAYVYKLWHRQYEKLLLNAPELFAGGTESAKRRPFNCHPAGRSYGGLARQCGRMAICPWCYMRQVAETYNSVISYRRKHMTGVTWYARSSTYPVTAQDLEDLPTCFRTLTEQRRQLFKRLEVHAGLGTIRLLRGTDGEYTLVCRQLFTKLGGPLKATDLKLRGKVRVIPSDKITTRQLEKLVGSVCAYPIWLQYAEPDQVTHYLSAVRESRFRSQVRYGGFRDKKETAND